MTARSRTSPREGGPIRATLTSTSCVVMIALACSAGASGLLRASVWMSAMTWSPVVVLVGAAAVLVLRRGHEVAVDPSSLSAARIALVLAAVSTILVFPLSLGPTFVVGLWGGIVGRGGQTAAIKGRRVPLTALSVSVLLAGLAVRFSGL